MKLKILIFTFFLILVYSNLEAKTSINNINFATNKYSISRNYSNFIGYSAVYIKNNGLKRFYTLLFVTGILFTLLGLLIDPIILIFGLVISVFSIILLLKN